MPTEAQRGGSISWPWHGRQWRLWFNRWGDQNQTQRSCSQEEGWGDSSTVKEEEEENRQVSDSLWCQSLRLRGRLVWPLRWHSENLEGWTCLEQA